MVLSTTRRPDKADPSVVRWLDGQNPYALHISAMTVFEIDLGASRLERSDPEHGAELRRWVDEVIEVFADRILPVDHEVAAVAAGYHMPDPSPGVDAMIAATAEVAGLGSSRATCATSHGSAFPF
ncbi:PIN domain-containing protein [Leifsonia xyli]|uniref:PIN domain-containing protein n=1 Tax=Leifsonia xyli TaxID=1575 RepID=UPI003D67C5E1